jgi:hypothetical protein
MQLSVDTSWWTTYRSDSQNLDFGDTLPQAIPDLAVGQHPAIPRNNDDLGPPDHLELVRSLPDALAYEHGVIMTLLARVILCVNEHSVGHHSVGVAEAELGEPAQGSFERGALVSTPAAGCSST